MRIFGSTSRRSASASERAMVRNPSGWNSAAMAEKPSTTSFGVDSGKSVGIMAFTNSAGILHDVDFGTPAFHIAAFDAGTRSLTFPTAGTLSFHCNLHAGMEATLVVR